MSNGQLSVSVNLTNQKVQFTGVSQSNPGRPVTFDFSPPIGDGQGFTGLELLLLSFAGCIATTIVYLLRRMGKHISEFQVDAKGVRRDQPPIALARIFLVFALRSGDTADGDMRKAIQLAEEAACPVWQMLKNNVDVVTEYQISN